MMAANALAWHTLALVSIATSSLFYTWIWYRPEDWMRLCKGSDPCARMALYAHLLKVVQVGSIAMCTDWALVKGNLHIVERCVPAVLFMVFGQHLNALVYKLLGQDGVYYGFRFNKTIPWVHSWPYSHLQDPQYIGSACTLIGCMILGFPVELCLHWLGNYLYLVWLERRVPT